MEDLVKLTDEGLERLKRINLEIVDYFVRFCKDHGLRVYVFAGTSLGAIRHHGFIPWDDDVDVVMPAPDYKKLVEIWDKEADVGHYSLCMETKEYNDHHLTASVRDNKTTFITTKSVNTDTNQGVAIDLAPLHAAARTKPGRAIQLVFASACSLFKAGRLPNRQSKFIYKASKVLLTIFRSENTRYYIWRTCEKIATLPDKHYEDAEYVKEFTMFPFITWLYPKAWFDETIWAPFEDTVLPIAKGTKEYLKKRYGNYMEYPPEEERHPGHKIVFMDLDTPYKEYRGIKYYKTPDKQ